MCAQSLKHAQFFPNGKQLESFSLTQFKTTTKNTRGEKKTTNNTHLPSHARKQNSFLLTEVSKSKDGMMMKMQVVQHVLAAFVEAVRTTNQGDRVACEQVLRR